MTSARPDAHAGDIRPPLVDFHSHMLERTAAEAGLPNSPSTGFGRRVPNLTPGTAFARANEASYDPQVHVDSLDRLGIDAEVLSSTAVIQGTSWTDPINERRLVGGINDEIRSWVSRHPTRFIGSFVLPLLDRAFALEELARCTGELGMRVVELPASVRGTYLGGPEFRYLWEALSDLGVVAFIHPDGTRDEWFQQYAMWNSIGQSIEEVKLITSLIYEGVLEEFPDVNMVIAHGGGFLPHNTGRLDRNVTAWPNSTQNISKKPSDYLRNLYYDTCVYDPTVLAALVSRVGADRIVMGSDFPVGDLDPVGFIRRCDLLSAAEVDQVTGGTAAELLGVRHVGGEGVLGVESIS